MLNRSPYLDRPLRDEKTARMESTIRRLISVWDSELEPTWAKRRELRNRIETALKQERARALNNHWTYDLNRHIALTQAMDWLNDELARLTGLEAAE